jgi:hypothetical protein
MIRVIDYRGKLVELTKERWQHIVAEHPEVKEFKDKLFDILSNPDLVKCSKKDKSVILYYRYYHKILGGKYLLAVAKVNWRSFLLTYYVTDKIKGGRIIWRKK